MKAFARALVGLIGVGATAGLLAPHTLPEPGPLAGPTAQATVLTTFALRLMATALCAYVGLVLLVLLLAHLRLLPAAVQRLVDRWTGAGIAGRVRHLVGASALAAGLLPLMPVAAHAAEAPPPVLAPMDIPQEEPPRLAPSPSSTAPVPPTSTTPSVTAADRPGTTVPRHAAEFEPSRPAPPPASRLTVIVEPGDSFWSIAEQLVMLRTQRPATDPEVIGPWLDLIATNRDVLPHPDDPDLLLPGTVLTLPVR